MNEEEIIRLFLKNGFQISKIALKLASDNPQKIISELKKIKPRPFIITEHHIKKILGNISGRQVDLNVIKEYTSKYTPTNVDNYVKSLSVRYEKIRSLLLKQMAPKKLVSINKINPRTTTFSIIGMVREKNDNSILVEDPTGESNLYFEENMMGAFKNILLDDVIGLRCERIKEKYYVKEVIYPDILASREINKTNDEIQIAIACVPSGSSAAIHKKLMDSLTSLEKISTLFLFSHFEIPTDGIPADFKLIQIHPNAAPKLFQLDKIKILAIPSSFFENFNTASAPEVFISVLKRRELLTPFPLIVNTHEDFILDETPDIVISDFGEAFHQNYKGTTLISNSNSQKVFFVNLKTREVHETQI